MQKNIIYIVGDNFSNFATFETVYTFSDIVRMVENNKLDKLKNSFFIIGQGVNREEKIQLEGYSRRNQMGLIINAYKRAASHDLTHKHKHENIMITEPLTITADKSYRAYLAVDDDCAEMNDHVTGHHVQGMVIIESARQMMLAVAEKYILQAEQKGNFYCILSSVASRYFHFAFPVDITLEHDIVQLDVNENGCYEIKTKTSYIQSNKVISEVDIDYKLYDKHVMYQIEHKLAERTIVSDASLQLENLYTETAA